MLRKAKENPMAFGMQRFIQHCHNISTSMTQKDSLPLLIYISVKENRFWPLEKHLILLCLWSLKCSSFVHIGSKRWEISMLCDFSPSLTICELSFWIFLSHLKTKEKKILKKKKVQFYLRSFSRLFWQQPDKTNSTNQHEKPELLCPIQFLQKSVDISALVSVGIQSGSGIIWHSKPLYLLFF